MLEQFTKKELLLGTGESKLLSWPEADEVEAMLAVSNNSRLSRGWFAARELAREIRGIPAVPRDRASSHLSGPSHPNADTAHRLYIPVHLLQINLLYRYFSPILCCYSTNLEPCLSNR